MRVIPRLAKRAEDLTAVEEGTLSRFREREVGGSRDDGNLTRPISSAGAIRFTDR